MYFNIITDVNNSTMSDIDRPTTTLEGNDSFRSVFKKAGIILIFNYAGLKSISFFQYLIWLDHVLPFVWK